MLGVKSTVFFAFVAISAQLAAAAPPGCLLAAVNTESNPADLSLLCGADSSKIQNQIKKLCGDDVEAALSAYKDTCKTAGKTISSDSSTSSTSSTASSSGSSPKSSLASGSSGSTTDSSESKPSTLASASATSAPYPVGSTVVVGSTGFATATGSGGIAVPTGSGGIVVPTGSSGLGAGSSATGSPILPSGTKTPGAPGSSSSPPYTGAAPKNLFSFGAAVLSLIGFAMAC